MVSQLTVGERLKLARKSKGYTQEEVGEAIKVGKSQISNIEKGNSDLTRANAIVLAELLGVALEWLLNGTEPKQGATHSGIVGSGNWQLHGDSNQVGGHNEQLQLKAALLENEQLKNEVERLEKYIKRLERLLDKQEE